MKPPSKIVSLLKAKHEGAKPEKDCALVFFIKTVNLKRNPSDLKKFFFRHCWWFVLTACLSALLFYGLSAFTARPTVETITTHAPVPNANGDRMREVDYQPRKPRRRGAN